MVRTGALRVASKSQMAESSGAVARIDCEFEADGLEPLRGAAHDGRLCHHERLRSIGLDDDDVFGQRNRTFDRASEGDPGAVMREDRLLVELADP